jgi:hypothetical protein
MILSDRGGNASVNERGDRAGDNGKAELLPIATLPYGRVSARIMKPIKFKSVLICDPPEKGWHYTSVEAKYAEKFEKKGGTRRVVCTLNGTETFPCALMPYNGIFYVMVNKEKRERLGLAAGDKVAVEIVADESEFGMPMPEELQEVLDQDPEGYKLFRGLKDGAKRSMMYYIGKFKDVDRRIHASLIFLEHLKNNDGKLDRRTLASELKRPIL